MMVVRIFMNITITFSTLLDVAQHPRCFLKAIYAGDRTSDADSPFTRAVKLPAPAGGPY
jgi:hypothetical protein